MAGHRSHGADEIAIASKLPSGERSIGVRVAQLGPDPTGPGGMPAVVAALLSSPLAERYRMEAIPTYRDSRPVKRLLLFLRSLLLLARWCVGPGLRIVHVHVAARGSMYRKAAVVAVAKVMRRPVVLQVHAGPADLAAFIEGVGPLRRGALRMAFAASDRVLSVSASGAETLHRLLTGVEITVVPNAPPAISLNKPHPAGDEVTILYLGGFDDRAKGGAVLLAALPSLLECPKARVVLAGPGTCPEAPPDGDRVFWRGWLDAEARDQALAEADVFVMPSISEGLPVALLEAMARGLPIVASRVGGVPEILTDGVDGTLVEPGDPEELADSLRNLIGRPDQRRVLGTAAAERAERLADEEDVYGKLDRIYRSLTS